MNIKKIGHCCLLVKTDAVTILTDPGTYSTIQDEVKGIDIVLITHEHQDHFHIDSVKKILANNPKAKIITNTTVAKLLEKEHIPCDITNEGGKNDTHGVLIEGYGCTHAFVYHEFGQTENTGYFIDGKLFYPGDAFTNPNRPVQILALPVAGPWMKISEAIDYALTIKPSKTFPVHDANSKSAFAHTILTKVCTEKGIEFVSMADGDEKEF